MLPGMIMLWSGAVVDIPWGWRLCDGNNDTPDLRNRFVVGAGDTYNPDDIGDTSAHTHTFTGDGHTHDLVAGASINAGANYDLTTSQAAITGTTNPRTAIPPYYALAYIMKI